MPIISGGGGGGSSTESLDFSSTALDAVSDNLKHVWSPGSAASGTISDSVGSSDLTIAGSNWRAVSGPAAGAGLANNAGRYGIMALSAAGASDYIGSTSAPSSWGDGDFSVSIQVYVYQVSTGAYWSLSNPANNTYLMLSQKTSFPSLGVQNGGVDGDRHLGDYSDWMHIVCTRDQSSGDINIYVNGVLRSIDSSYSTVDFSGQGFYVGRQNLSSDNQPTEAAYGEIAIWDTVLSRDAVSELYNNGRGRYYNA